MSERKLLVSGFTFLLAGTIASFGAHGQSGGMVPSQIHAQVTAPAEPPAQKPLLSPPAVASLTLEGQTVQIKYNSPSMRGREIYGGLVPYGKVWRTGANPATTLITPISLHIGNLLVPAGTYTMYTLPEKSHWMLIINKHNKQWGTEYYDKEDLGRVKMDQDKIETPQEVMSISFDHVEKNSAVMHIRWAKTDESVKVSTP